MGSTSQSPLYDTLLELGNVTVKSFSATDFQLRYDTPGTQVYDYTLAAATNDQPATYTVPASPAELKQAIENAAPMSSGVAAEPAAPAVPPVPKGGGWMLFLAANSVLLLAIAAFILWKQRLG